MSLQLPSLLDFIEDDAEDSPLARPAPELVENAAISSDAHFDSKVLGDDDVAIEVLALSGRVLCGVRTSRHATVRQIKVEIALKLGFDHDEWSLLRGEEVLAMEDAQLFETSGGATVTLNVINSDPKARAAAAEAELFSHPDHQVREQAVMRLFQLGPAAAPYLSKALADEDTFIRVFAAQGLARLGEAEGIESLRSDLRHEHDFIRSAAANAIGKLGDKAALFADDLALALRDENSSVRGEAAEALGRLGPEIAGPYAPQLARAIFDNDGGVQREAVEALGNLGPAAKPYVGKLARLLKVDHSDYVRIAAAESLGKLGDPRGLPLLEFSLANMRGQKIRSNIREALENVQRAQGIDPTSTSSDDTPRGGGRFSERGEGRRESCTVS